MQPSIKQKNTKVYPLQTLEYLSRSNKIWLNPDYQRESVWTKNQKQLLIDSLLQDIDIPKLYFRSISRNGFEYEVVDGQQRLRSIFEYLKGEYKTDNTASDVNGEEVANRSFLELSTDMQIKLQSTQIDIVVLVNYSDDDIEDMFLRLQNGTPLNAAEKRKAIPGNMRNIVEDLSKHKVFSFAGYKDNRYAYEDTIAKILHEMLSPTLTDIRHASIRKTYESYRDISMNDRSVKKTVAALNFINRSFKDKNPKFKKFSLITLAHLVSELLEEYDLSSYGKEFAKVYLDFEYKRAENGELPEEQQDSELSAYTDAARADGIQHLKFRHDLLLRTVVENIPNLKLKDPKRDFSDEQRVALYHRDNGICQNCSKHCEPTNFHADHKLPWSAGNPTSLINGQVLCPDCNLTKGNRA